LATGRRLFYLEGAIADAAWHPRKLMVAFYWATGEPLPPDMHVDRGLGYVDLTTGRIKRFPDPNLDEEDGVSWLPDGYHIICSEYAINTRTGKRTDLLSTWVPYSLDQRVTASTARYVAIERDGGGDPPVINIWRYKQFNPNSMSPVGELRSTSKNSQSSVQFFRSQPDFLKDGRLAYVRVQVNRDGVHGDAGIWTSTPNGKNERPWIALPQQRRENQGFSVEPIGWSPDGTVVVRANGTKLIVCKVRRA
jgi:hypothetical protein